MITEDFCSYEVAKLLKEKGFDMPCDNYYDSSGKTPNESVYGEANIETLDYNADPFVKSGFPKFKTFSAPTQSMAMKWLREIHKLFIMILLLEKEEGNYGYTVEKIESREIISTSGNISYDTTEDAVEAALKYTLENLI